MMIDHQNAPFPVSGSSKKTNNVVLRFPSGSFQIQRDFPPSSRAALQHPMVRSRGDATRNSHQISAEAVGWTGKFTHALVAADKVASVDEILAQCPSVETIIKCLMTLEHMSTFVAVWNGPLNNLFLIVGCVLMKHRRYAEAIQYAEAAIDPDLAKAGTNAPLTCIVAKLMIGRASLALARGTPVPVLRSALEESQRYDLRLYAKFAKRELRQAEEADISTWTPDEEVHTELVTMKISALKKRALAAGIDASAVDAVDDSDDPKQSLVALLLLEAEKCSTADSAGSLAASEALRAGPIERLRLELMSMKLSELQSSALAKGASVQSVDAVYNAENPKEAIVALLIETQVTESTTPVIDTQQTSLRSELARLTVSELRKRALAAGISDETTLAVFDNDDPKTAIVDLIANHEPSEHSPAAQSRPHFGNARPTGSGSGGSKPTAPTAPTRAGRDVWAGGHTMLSYNWDVQEAVVRVRKELTTAGIPCWMDMCDP
eukprot:SAG11_NODE_2574_length_3208_cov_1.487938_1_plen_492_part_00